MVTNVTSFGRSGLYDWVTQRVTAVVVGAYSIFLLAYVLFSPELTYEQWSGLFSQNWMRIFSLLTLLCIAGHAWVGLWTVATDYIKPTGLRFVFQSICGAVMFAYFVWGIEILWSI